LGHAFITCDAYREYAIYTGIEKDKDQTTVYHLFIYLWKMKNLGSTEIRASPVPYDYEELSEK